MFQYLYLLESDREKEFLASIYEAHRKEMYYIAYHILHNPSDAEDIVQETFLTLIKHVDKLIDNEPHKVWAYISTTVRNKALNVRRHKKSLEEVELDETWMQEDILEDGPDLLLAGYEQKEALIKLLKQLKSPYKEVLALQYYHELSAAEIGKLLGKSPDNIRHISMRAKKKLQSLLKKNGLWNKKK